MKISKTSFIEVIMVALGLAVSANAWANHDSKHCKMHEKHTKEFVAADTDNDGTLTKEEAAKLPNVAKNFDAIDADKDGTVDRDEVHTFMHAQKKKK